MFLTACRELDCDEKTSSWPSFFRFSLAFEVVDIACNDVLGFEDAVLTKFEIKKEAKSVVSLSPKN